MIQEYIVKYQAGTSPYWYNYSVYAESEKSAFEQFTKSEGCPYNVRKIEVFEARSYFAKS